MKICNKCKRELGLDKFGKLKSAKDGLRYECKECRNALTREDYNKNPDKYLISSKKWKREHKEQRALRRRRWIS